ncbi:CAAX protease self-immunity [Reichenbachiella agariperforans]|uniref:CAAX protease self-immunity n=1 Tax=Reichenbachiella agariperforans TaxID=156994 RepID=A0A1M6RWY4_REIAG|nr:CPBP family intramembrane glutamic endopeptidase [Reichenbachiella agariperforans]SHK36819.1 CAAX protease self-immunity [Reichenbachiella agariperforans]
MNYNRLVRHIAYFFLGTLMLCLPLIILFVGGFITFLAVPFDLEAFLAFFVGFFFFALIEELIFRYYLLNGLLIFIKSHWAIIISSMIFATAHVLNPEITMLGFVNVFLISIVLGFIFITYDKSIGECVALHFGWNFSCVAFFGMPVSGISIPSILFSSMSENSILTGSGFGIEGSILLTIELLTILLIFKIKKFGAGNSV